MYATRISKRSSDASTLWDIARAYADDSFCEPLKSRVLGFIRGRNVEGLCSLTLPDPEHHGQDFIHLRQLQAFFKKNEAFSDDAKCSAAARTSFEQAERICRVTNKRLDYFYTQRDRLDPDLRLWVTRAERFIETALGEVGMFIDRIPDLVKVTGGATEDRPRKDALPFLKISRTIRAPTRALPLVECFLKYSGNTRPLRMHAVDANRVTFVPKNYKTHRTIACEPTAALPFQLAFDSYVKTRLRRYGCDLRTQEKNQELARIGSVTGEFATLDLSMASDTLSYNTVAWLLPVNWFQFIDRLRAKRYNGDVGSGEYAKFSSMGNGTTFALETLIFLACIRAVGSKQGTTYGDDLIVETELVPKLLKLLRFLGFRINTSKSFVVGPFRESCGADWLSGRLVTPFYVRKIPRTRAELCHLINGVSRISLPYGKVWQYLRSLTVGLPLVPESQDTASGIHVSYEKARSLGLIVSESKQFGPHIPVARQFVESGDTLAHHGVRSYVIFLLFGGRVSAGVTKVDGKIRVIEPSSLTMWNTGLTRRKLRLAPCRPWSSNFTAMGLWEEFISPQVRP